MNRDIDTDKQIDRQQRFTQTERKKDSDRQIDRNIHSQVDAQRYKQEIENGVWYEYIEREGGETWRLH